MQEAVAVTTAIQEEIFLEMGIGKFVLQMLNLILRFFFHKIEENRCLCPHKGNFIICTPHLSFHYVL